MTTEREAMLKSMSEPAKAKPAHTPYDYQYVYDAFCDWEDTGHANPETEYIMRAVSAYDSDKALIAELVDTLRSARQELNSSTRYDYIDEMIHRAEESI
jgi:hypothetical protein